MKVKVIKSGLPTYWYADRIGEVFEVQEYYGGYSVLSLVGHTISKEDVEIMKEVKSNTSAFDMKKEAWFIPYHCHEQFLAIKDWLIFEKGLDWSFGDRWQLFASALTNLKSNGEITTNVVWSTRPDNSPAKEIKLSFKTIIDSVEYPVVETDQQKQIRELEQTIAKASEQIKALRGEEK